MAAVEDHPLFKEKEGGVKVVRITDHANVFALGPIRHFVRLEFPTADEADAFYEKVAREYAE